MQYVNLADAGTTTQPGTLLSMVREFTKCNPSTPSFTRLHVLSAADDFFSLNMFIMGKSKPMSHKDSLTGKKSAAPRPYCNAILKFVSKVQNEKYLLEYPDLNPREVCFEKLSLQYYLSKYHLIGSVERKVVRLASKKPSMNLQVLQTAATKKQYWLYVVMANSE